MVQYRLGGIIYVCILFKFISYNFGLEADRHSVKNLVNGGAWTLGFLAYSSASEAEKIID